MFDSAEVRMKVLILLWTLLFSQTDYVYSRIFTRYSRTSSGYYYAYISNRQSSYNLSIVGAFLGCLIVTVLVVFICMLCYYRAKKEKQERQQTQVVAFQNTAYDSPPPYSISQSQEIQKQNALNSPPRYSAAISGADSATSAVVGPNGNRISINTNQTRASEDVNNASDNRPKKDDADVPTHDKAGLVENES